MDELKKQSKKAHETLDRLIEESKKSMILLEHLQKQMIRIERLEGTIINCDECNERVCKYYKTPYGTYKSYTLCDNCYVERDVDDNRKYEYVFFGNAPY